MQRKSRVPGIARRALVALVTLALTAGQWLGVLGTGATEALAAQDTIEGTCTLSNCRYVTGEGFTADVTMPNGQVLAGYCYERWSGDYPDHEMYPGPCAGEYGFEATRQPDGSYRVIVDSSGASCSYNGYPAPAGYTFQRVIVTSWRPYVDVSFTKCSADVSVTGNNAEYKLEGAEYDIHRASDDSLVAHIVIDSNGHASYQLLPNVHYYAVETKAPQGFKVNPNSVEFTTGNNEGTEQLSDDPGFVRLKIDKKDSATLGDAQPGATLEGAEFRCVSKSTPGWSTTATTDASGTLWFDYVPFGEIEVTETKAPTGYRLDTQSHTYTVHAGEVTSADPIVLEPEDDYRETVKAFDLEIAKTLGSPGEWDQGDGQSRPAAGVQFQVISNTTGEAVGTLTTNASGLASTKDASTCDDASVSEERTDDAGRPWFGKGRRNAGIDGAIPYDEAGYTIHEVESTVPDGYASPESRDYEMAA